jgi:hypothetical protein
MIIRIQDENGDMTFGNGSLNFYDNSPEGAAQAIQTALLLWYGEWFLDNTVGVPYLENVLGKNSQASADLEIKDQILSVQVIDNGVSTQLVNSIDNYLSSLDPVTRKLTLSATLNTIYGPTPLEVSDYAIF